MVVVDVHFSWEGLFVLFLFWKLVWNLLVSRKLALREGSFRKVVLQESLGTVSEEYGIFISWDFLLPGNHCKSNRLSGLGVSWTIPANSSKEAFSCLILGWSLALVGSTISPDEKISLDQVNRTLYMFYTILI